MLVRSLEYSGLEKVRAHYNRRRQLPAQLPAGPVLSRRCLTNTEHPPAAGTALGLGVIGWDPSAVLFVLLGAIALSIIHRLLRSRLQNLL